MLNKALSLLLAIFVCTAFGACKKSSKDDQAAKDKAWREQQTKKAIANYQKIVAEYPDTEYAVKAKDRLRALGAPQEAPPTPKK